MRVWYNVYALVARKKELIESVNWSVPYATHTLREALSLHTWDWQRKADPANTHLYGSMR